MSGVLTPGTMFFVNSIITLTLTVTLTLTAQGSPTLNA
eukprot:gene15900-22381_t